jgi:hypothetical protein
MVQLENINPLQGGIFRMKHPSERRPSFPRESALTFYPTYIWDLISKNFKVVSLICWMLATKRRIDSDPDRFSYMDRALTPVRDDEEEETLDLLTKTGGAKAAIAHLKKVDRLTHLAAAE